MQRNNSRQNVVCLFNAGNDEISIRSISQSHPPKYRITTTEEALERDTNAANVFRFVVMLLLPARKACMHYLHCIYDDLLLIYVCLLLYNAETKIMVVFKLAICCCV